MIAGEVTDGFGLIASGETGAAYSAISNLLGSGSAFLGFSGDPDLPKAYLTYHYFDLNHNYITSGFVQVSEGANGSFEELSLQLTTDQQGYVYIYVANETMDDFNVFFDDLEVAHSYSLVVQKDDYYPFGLTFNSYTSGTENLYKYNSFEEQKETGWYDYLARQYDPALGRFTSIDPAADLMRRMSPYAYAFNNPIRFIDPDGMVPTTGDQDKEEEKKKEEKQKQEQETRKKLEEYYAQFGMTLEEGVGMVKSDATSKESDAKKSYESGSSTEKKKGPSNWEMMLTSAGQANDIVEFYGEISGVKVPGKIGTAITIFQVGDKYFKQDEAGMWVEVGKAALGRLVGGYTILAAETFIATGKAQAHQIGLNMNGEAMKLYRTGIQLQQNGNEQLANKYFERAIEVQNKAIDLAQGLLNK